MASRTPFALRRRATYLAVLLVGFVALGVLAARGASLWLDGQSARMVALIEAATGGSASIGQWQVTSRGVNPVVRATDVVVRFDGVEALHLQRLDVELDLIESLARSVPVARGLELAGGRVALMADADGLRLRGAAPRPMDDTLLRMLAESDAVALGAVEVEFTQADRNLSCSAVLGAWLRGVGGRHTGRLQLASGDATAELDFDFAGAALAWRTWRGDARLAWSHAGTAACTGITPPPQLADARIDSASGRAELHFDTGHLSSVASLTLAGAAAHTEFVMENVPLRLSWRSQRLRLAAATDGIWLGGVALFPAGGDIEAELNAGRWRLTAPDTRLELLAERLVETDLLKEVHSRWLRSLAPRGGLGTTQVLVADGSWKVQAPFAQLAMRPYKGAPGISGANGRVMIMPGVVHMRLDAGPAQLSFPVVFSAAPPAYERIAGTIDMVFEPGWTAIMGHQLEADSPVARVSGDFALWRPEEAAEQVLYLDVGIHDGTPRAIKHYIPNGLSAGLQQWLRDSVVNDRGQITDGRLVYHGHLKVDGNAMRRRAALGARLVDIDFRYHPDWPIATVADGAMVVDASGVTARAAHFRLQGNEFTDAFARLPHGSDILRLRGTGVVDADAAIGLLQATPMRESIAFVEDGWQARGPVALDFDGRVPLPGAQVDPEVHVDLVARGVDVHNPELKLDVTDIRGPLSYDYPARFVAPGLTGRFLDQPVDIRMETPDSVRIHIDGRTDVQAVARWTGQGLINATSGELSYHATANIPLDSDALSLDIRSDLVGVKVALPEPVGKTAASPRPSELHMWFPGEDTTMLQYDYGVDIQGISEIKGGWISRAVVALAGAEPLLPADSRVSVRGSLHRASMDEWLAAGEVMAGEDVDAMPPVHLDNLQIDRLYAFDRVFEEIRLDALDLRDEWRIEFASAEFSGRAVVPDVGVIGVDLEYMHLPAGEPGTSSISYMEFSGLPDLDVSIGELRIGGDDYGRWRFDLRATADVLQLENIVGEARGVKVGTEEAPATLVWSRAGGIDRTRFDGVVFIHDVEAAQVAWGLEPSLVAEDLTATAAVAWPGTPDAMSPAALSGHMSVRSGAGRFEQMETGANALRILGIFNFAALSRRARLDFSDVLGKGMSFDTIKAELDFEDGMLRLSEPALVEGTGSKLRITGVVDLTTWALDNEVVLTLPVSRSLPWYAAYAALANPLAGAGVLLAERLLRDQLDSFSSARYHVTGTLDDPKLTFVNIFDTTPPAVANAGEPEPES